MSCTSSSDCVAVGFLLSPQRPISLQWNGSWWVQLATAPSFINPYLPATISCDPQGTCLSGEFGGKTDESPSHPVSALWTGTSGRRYQLRLRLGPPAPPSAWSRACPGLFV